MTLRLSTLAAMAALVPAAFAQTPVQPVSIRLVETITEPTLVERNGHGSPTGNPERVYENEYEVVSSSKAVYTYEYGATASRYRISNREIVEGLVEVGVIPNVIGWEVVYVDDNYMAVTKNGVFIQIDDYVSFTYADVDQENAKYRYTQTTTNSGTVEKWNGKYRYEDIAFFDVTFTDLDVEIQSRGLVIEDYLESGQTGRAGKSRIGKKVCHSISGTLYDAINDYTSLIEGSVIMGKGVDAFVPPQP